MFKLMRVMTRVAWNGKAPEHNPTVLEHLPRGGLVGYTTNNPQLAFLLLSEPAERFNFHVKDFSSLDDSVDFERKAVIAGANYREADFNSMYARKNIDSGDIFNSNTVFTHQFPRDVEEAKALEQRDGGVNMFMHIEFDAKAGDKWDERVDTRVLECQTCGKVVRTTPELIEAKNNETEQMSHIVIGEKTNCNLDSSMCSWKDATIAQLGSSDNQAAESKRNNTNNEQAKDAVEQDHLTDLHRYFEDRGLFVNFNVDSNMGLNKARVELLRHIAGGFKL